MAAGKVIIHFCLRIYRSFVMPRPASLYRVPGAMNERRHNKRWRLLGLSMLYPLPLLVSFPTRARAYTRAHTHTHTTAHNTKEKKMYQTPATAVNDFRIFPLRSTDKYLEEQKKRIAPG